MFFLFATSVRTVLCVTNGIDKKTSILFLAQKGAYLTYDQGNIRIAEEKFQSDPIMLKRSAQRAAWSK